MATARDIIKGAMRLIGLMATGETPSADEISDGLSSLNSMIDSWSNENLVIYTKIREEFDFVPSQAAYTMGAGGNFNTSRPMRIDNAAVQMQGTTVYEVPIEVVTVDQWAGIVNKQISGSIPKYVYPEGTYPNETLNFWPIPSVTNKAVLYSWKPLATFASANDTFSMPPGYEEAIKYNLAVRFAPEFNKEASPTVQLVAIEAKENIKRMNTKPQLMGCDLAVVNRGDRFNYLTGE
jgi:hypothetical protein